MSRRMRPAKQPPSTKPELNNDDVPDTLLWSGPVEAIDAVEPQMWDGLAPPLYGHEPEEILETDEGPLGRPAFKWVVDSRHHPLQVALQTAGVTETDWARSSAAVRRKLLSAAQLIALVSTSVRALAQPKRGAPTAPDVVQGAAGDFIDSLVASAKQSLSSKKRPGFALGRMLIRAAYSRERLALVRLLEGARQQLLQCRSSEARKAVAAAQADAVNRELVRYLRHAHLRVTVKDIEALKTTRAAPVATTIMTTSGRFPKDLLGREDTTQIRVRQRN